MDIAERYRAAVVAAFDASRDDGELLPKLLSEACVAVLPVQGAGISVLQDLRVPLGASDPMAALAERLQTTLGEGPCLDAVKTPLPLAVGEDAIQERWPVFGAEFLTRTPYRSVASLPLIPPRGTQRLGAMDLYLTAPEPMGTRLLFELAASVANPVAAVLAGSPVGEDAAGITMPVWLNSDLVHARMEVWAAVGVVLVATPMENADALALLRAYAYGHGTSLDDVASRLTSGALEVGEIVEAAALG
ncbi:hypothetical protein SAMN04488543_3760 [Friedmanniella luteola]|uniref:ANTAR domain-containing protein n=1 Tax=Friedmanniella luteola TaxID=546871 RepID=A0A1H1ZHV5_9ACTN|nr:GAF domain-containing protein [Friedmanniella luteola]SDT32766.1 hypothetical protein SAMN04488543_3760 [Friedmanniella luteola]